MTAHWLAIRTVKFSAALMLASALIGIGPRMAIASTCVSWTGTPPLNPSSTGDSFTAVAAHSPCDVLAVGTQQAGVASHTLVEQWNGLQWKTMPSANPGSSTDDNVLQGVAALSGSTAWAVGRYSNGTANQTLIEALSGGVWEQESSPNPAGTAHDNFLNAVAATSAKNAWAVGDFSSGTNLLTLIARWNGSTWSQVPSPSPGNSENELLGVAATSAKNAWAVGLYANNHGSTKTLIEHWNGKAWKRVPSPNPSGVGNNQLQAVAAGSASNAWAVGSFVAAGGADVPLALHWNGRAWQRVPTPSLGTPLGGGLAGVAILSAKDAWAVGSFNSSGTKTLAEHWNGRRWSREASPDPGSFNDFLGVATTAPAAAWAVGTYDAGGPDLTLAAHCC